MTGLPAAAGVYLYFDKNDVVIYVGKAKNIKKRVSSYFSNKHTDIKTRRLIDSIIDIQYFIVSTESDALLLENNLIKKHNPRYNVMLKDDKTYPWICVKNEPFPRVFLTRKIVNDGSDYFGPYTSNRLIRIILDFIKSLYPLRTCRFNLSDQNIIAKKFKVCLDYHIGTCLGPCEGLQESLNYDSNIAHIKNILNGDLRSVQKFFTKEMKKYSDQLDFEKAEDMKQKLYLLSNYQSKSTIVNSKIHNVDVFTIVSDEKIAFVNYLKISNGSIIQTYNAQINKKLNETDQQILEIAITEIRLRFNSISKNIYSSIDLPDLWGDTKVYVPKIGDKYKLIELSLRNASHMMLNKDKNIDNSFSVRNMRVLNQLKNDLNLSDLPSHIECFDNSNLHGTNPVASCVVFIDGKPRKKEYRHFNIKTVIGSDDFASMEEVVFRRYNRLIKEKRQLPNLIIVDGGKGQLSAAAKSLKKLGLLKKIPLISIAKRLEEIFMYGDSYPLYLDKTSSSLKIIQRLRDESHRFAISHHRNRRVKKGLEISLESIPGIGKITISKILNKFGSIRSAKLCDRSEMEDLIGLDKSKKVYDYWNL